MQRPGRNDPCPCGSGKKYKRCCLGKEAQRERFAAQLEAHALPLLRELGQFAARRAALPPEKVAAERFPFWRPPLSPAQGARLLEYLIFDYRAERHGPTAAAEFAEQRGPLLAPPAQALLRGWVDAATELYLLESWSGGFTRCRSALDAATPAIEVMPLERQDALIAAGSPVALRALAVGAAFIYPALPIAFGSRTLEDVLAAMQARHHAFVRRERIVPFEEFLRLEPTAFDEEAAAAASAPRIIVPGR